MDVFIVTKPGGTKDYEFEAYSRLLEEIGVDVAKVPRIPEPGTHRRWLYTWRRKEEAQAFARELKFRKEQILSLGGYRVILPYGEIGHEELPEIPVQAITSLIPLMLG